MTNSKAGRRDDRPNAGPIVGALVSCRRALVFLLIASAFVNLLTLSGSLYMMQVYDRVLGSQSVPTLAALSAVLILAIFFQGVLEIGRARLLGLIGEMIDVDVSPKVYQAALESPLKLIGRNADSLQPFRDAESIRGFVAGPGPLAFFDLPWVPINLLIVTLLHPYLGLMALAAAIVMIVLTLATDAASQGPTRKSIEAIVAQNQLAEAAIRSSEVVRAMGMQPVLKQRWLDAHDQHLLAQRNASFVVGSIAGIAKMFRVAIQSAALGFGAYLAVKGQLSAGSIIAASILTSRTLAPIDQAIGAWRGFVGACQAFRRLNRQLLQLPPAMIKLDLPAPSKSLVVEGLHVAAPDVERLILRRVTLRLKAGQAVGVIGPSASGKSTLGRALVGIWPAHMGRITLDGASLDQWRPESLGPSIGYLPQDVQLLEGSVAQNISRFIDKANADAVIASAHAAGLHDYVLGLSDGYNTQVGPGGTYLSSGQRQRLGLARALYGNPFLVVLDEPNANLDAEGEAAVAEAIMGVRKRGGIAVVIAHRTSAIAAVDMLLMLGDGDMIAFRTQARGAR